MPKRTPSLPGAMFGGSSDEDTPEIPSLGNDELIGATRSGSGGIPRGRRFGGGGSGSGTGAGSGSPSHILAAESSSIGRASPSRIQNQSQTRASSSPSSSSRTPRSGSRLNPATGLISTGKLMEVDKPVPHEDPPPPFTDEDPFASRGLRPEPSAGRDASTGLLTLKDATRAQKKAAKAVAKASKRASGSGGVNMSGPGDPGAAGSGMGNGSGGILKGGLLHGSGSVADVIPALDGDGGMSASIFKPVVKRSTWTMSSEAEENAMSAPPPTLAKKKGVTIVAPRNVLKVAVSSSTGQNHETDSIGKSPTTGGTRSKRRSSIIPTLSNAPGDPHDLIALQHAGILLFNRDPDAGLRHLLLQGCVEPDAEKVGDFLMRTEGFSRLKVGDFLGDMTRTINISVLTAFAESLDFGDVPIVDALRAFLTGFHLPLDQRRCEVILQAFAGTYFKTNEHLYGTQLAVLQLAFSCIMLNAGLHGEGKATSEETFISQLEKVQLASAGGAGHGARANLSYDKFKSGSGGAGADDASDATAGDEGSLSRMNLRPMMVEAYNAIVTKPIRPLPDHTDVARSIFASMSKLPAEVDIETWLPPHRFFVKFFEVVWVEDASKATPKGKKQRVIFLFSDMIVLTKKRKTSYEFREVLTLRQTRTRVLGMPDLHPFGLALYHSQTGKILMQLSSRNRDEQGDLMSTINMLEVQVDFEVTKQAEVLDELVGPPFNDHGPGKLDLFLLGPKSQADATTIERRLARLDGILSVDINAETRKGVFRFDADVLGPKRIVRFIKALDCDCCPWVLRPDEKTLAHMLQPLAAAMQDRDREQRAKSAGRKKAAAARKVPQNSDSDSDDYDGDVRVRTEATSASPGGYIAAGTSHSEGAFSDSDQYDDNEASYTPQHVDGDSDSDDYGGHTNPAIMNRKAASADGYLQVRASTTEQDGLAELVNAVEGFEAVAASSASPDVTAAEEAAMGIQGVHPVDAARNKAAARKARAKAQANAAAVAANDPSNAATLKKNRKIVERLRRAQIEAGRIDPGARGGGGGGGGGAGLMGGGAFYSEDTIFQVANSGDLEALIMLLNSNRRGIDVVNADGRTLLMHSVHHNHVDCVDLLVARGANVNHISNIGTTALHEAAFHADASMINRLLASGGDPTILDQGNRSALHWSTDNPSTDTLEALLLAGGSVHASGKRLDINAVATDGMTAAMYAAYNDRSHHLAILVKRGADLEEKDVDGKTAYHWAVHRRDAKCLKKILDMPSTFYKDKLGRTVAHICGELGGKDAVAAIVEARADAINDPDKDGRTPLMWAAACNNKVVLQALLAEGAGLAVKDNTGTTALGHAQAMGNKQCIEILSEAVGATAVRKPPTGSLFRASSEPASAGAGGGASVHGQPTRDNTF